MNGIYENRKNDPKQACTEERLFEGTCREDSCLFSQKLEFATNFLLIASQRRNPEYNLVSTSSCHKYKRTNLCQTTQSVLLC